MNCDQVFEVLTQGPFPTGKPVDDKVERHIACCHECRQMAEALRPAVDLFHESIAEMEQGKLPEYRGRLGNSSLATLPAMVEACAVLPRSRANEEFALGRRSQSFLRRQSTSILAASLMIVALVVVVIGAVPTFEAVSKGVNPSERPSDDGQLEKSAGFSLAQLSQACFKHDGPALSAATPTASPKTLSRDLQCCTLCHNAALPARPRIDSIAVLEKSCSGCHSH